MKRSIGLALLLAASVGCGRWDTVSYTDEGELCFSQNGNSVEVTVTAPDCLSSSCSRRVEGSCEATVDGTTIVLTSEIEWEDKQGPTSCTLDCGQATAECLIPALAEGTYTVVHGEEETQLVVPVQAECFL